MKTLQIDPMNLIITGVGGQGNVRVSRILGQALIGQGFNITVGETFGLSQRGGSVQSHVRISARHIYGPLIPEGRAHLIMGLEPLETLRVLAPYGSPNLNIVVNSRPVPPLNVSAGDAAYPTNDELLGALDDLSARVWWVEATETAKQLGGAIMANIVMLGALSATGLLPVRPKDIEKSMAAILSAELFPKNRNAFRKGMELSA